MPILTRKFSQFVPAAPDEVVGLTAGANSIGPSSGGGSGAVTQVITQANAFSVGQWIRFDVGSNMYVTAIATTPQNAEVIGVAIVVSPTQFTLQQSGYVTLTQAVFPVLTPGQPQFLSDAVAGAMINVDVLIDGEVSRPVFIPDKVNATNSSGWVLPYRGLIAGGGADMGGGAPPAPGTDTSIVTVTQNGHGLNPGDWVRVDTPGAGPQVHYVKALADTLANSQAVGVVIQVINVNSFRLQFSGYVATDLTTNTTAPFEYVSAPGPIFSPLVPKTVYYLSNLNAGQLVAVDPSTISATAMSKPLFVSEQTIGTVNKNAGYILPQRPLSGANANPNASPYIFLGTLNHGNNYSSTSILQDSNGNTFGAYIFIVRFGLSNGTNQCIRATSATNLGIGFQFYAGGYVATNHATYTSGVNSSAGLNTATWWGYVENTGVGVGSDNCVLLPRLAPDMRLVGGNGVITIGTATGGLAGAGIVYNIIGTDVTGATHIGYTSIGSSSSGLGVGPVTGFKVYFDSASPVVIDPNNLGYIDVYGIPNS